MPSYIGISYNKNIAIFSVYVIFKCNWIAYILSGTIVLITCNHTNSAAFWGLITIEWGFQVTQW